MNRRPAKTEYVEYFDRYVRLVPDGDIVETLRDQLQSTQSFLRGIPRERVTYRYAPGKWTLQQVVGHVLDMEWIFVARAIHFARAAGAPLPDADPDKYMEHSSWARADWPLMLDQFVHVRTASALFYQSCDETAWSRQGIASGNPVTVRALAWIAAGHERHHVAVIRERYLPG